MKKATADYTYTIDDGVLCIVDLDTGSRSVTNDIENVLDDILLLDDILYRINGGNGYQNIIVIYRDSQGLWDEVIGWPDKIEFKSISVSSKTRAIEIVKHRYA